MLIVVECSRTAVAQFFGEDCDGGTKPTTELSNMADPSGYTLSLHHGADTGNRNSPTVSTPSPVVKGYSEPSEKQSDDLESALRIAYEAMLHLRQRTLEEAWRTGYLLTEAQGTADRREGGFRGVCERAGVPKTTAYRLIELYESYPEVSHVGHFTSVDQALAAARPDEKEALAKLGSQLGQLANRPSVVTATTPTVFVPEVVTVVDTPVSYIPEVVTVIPEVVTEAPAASTPSPLPVPSRRPVVQRNPDRDRIKALQAELERYEDAAKVWDEERIAMRERIEALEQNERILLSQPKGTAGIMECYNEAASLRAQKATLRAQVAEWQTKYEDKNRLVKSRDKLLKQHGIDVHDPDVWMRRERSA